MRTCPPGLFPFEGFPHPAHEQFTQIPNQFFDLIPLLDERELRVLLVIMRDTFGWHQQTANPSLAELKRRTGMNDRQLQRGLLGTGKTAQPGEGCVPKGLVLKETTSRKGLKGMKGRNRYTIHLHDTIQMAVSQNAVNLAVSDTVNLDASQMAVSTTNKEEKERSTIVDVALLRKRQISALPEDQDIVPLPEDDLDFETWQDWPEAKRRKWGQQFMSSIFGVYWEEHRAAFGEAPKFSRESKKLNGKSLAGCIARRLGTATPADIKTAFRYAFRTDDHFISSQKGNPLALLSDGVFNDLSLKAQEWEAYAEDR